MDTASESQQSGTAAEVCRRCLERHVEGVESCMENAYSSRSRFNVPRAQHRHSFTASCSRYFTRVACIAKPILRGRGVSVVYWS